MITSSLSDMSPVCRYTLRMNETPMLLHKQKHPHNKTATWIWRICHGIDEDEVKFVERIKRFASTKNLSSVTDRQAILRNLRVVASELLVRMISDRKQWNRASRTLVLQYSTNHSSNKSVSTTMPPLPTDEALTEQKNREQYLDQLVQVFCF